MSVPKGHLGGRLGRQRIGTCFVGMGAEVFAGSRNETDSSSPRAGGFGFCFFAMLSSRLFMFD